MKLLQIWIGQFIIIIIIIIIFTYYFLSRASPSPSPSQLWSGSISLDVGLIVWGSGEQVYCRSCDAGMEIGLIIWLFDYLTIWPCWQN